MPGRELEEIDDDDIPDHVWLELHRIEHDRIQDIDNDLSYEQRKDILSPILREFNQRHPIVYQDMTENQALDDVLSNVEFKYICMYHRQGMDLDYIRRKIAFSSKPPQGQEEPQGQENELDHHMA